MSLTLGSFNLLSGRSLSDGLIVASRLSSSVSDLDVDVLAVQEVDSLQPRSGLADQPALVSSAIGAVAGRYVATVAGTPGSPGWTAASGPVDGPAYGVGLYSRLPVAEWHELRLRPARGRFPLMLPTRPPQMLWLPDEPRAAVALVLSSPRLTVACTHLSFVPGVNVAQLLAVRSWLLSLPAPRVLLGDLNLPSSLARRLTGWTPLVSAPTYPSPAPQVQLDHALASELPPGVHAAGQTRLLEISDHQALKVTLTLP